MMWLYVGRDGRNLDMESLGTLCDKQPALRKVANKKNEEGLSLRDMVF